MDKYGPLFVIGGTVFFLGTLEVVKRRYGLQTALKVLALIGVAAVLGACVLIGTQLGVGVGIGAATFFVVIGCANWGLWHHPRWIRAGVNMFLSAIFIAALYAYVSQLT